MGGHTRQGIGAVERVADIGELGVLAMVGQK